MGEGILRVGLLPHLTAHVQWCRAAEGDSNLQLARAGRRSSPPPLRCGLASGPYFQSSYLHNCNRSPEPRAALFFQNDLEGLAELEGGSHWVGWMVSWGPQPVHFRVREENRGASASHSPNLGACPCAQGPNLLLHPTFQLPREGDNLLHSGSLSSLSLSSYLPKNAFSAISVTFEDVCPLGTVRQSQKHTQ